MNSRIKLCHSCNKVLPRFHLSFNVLDTILNKFVINQIMDLCGSCLEDIGAAGEIVKQFKDFR